MKGHVAKLEQRRFRIDLSRQEEVERVRISLESLLIEIYYLIYDFLSYFVAPVIFIKDGGKFEVLVGSIALHMFITLTIVAVNDNSSWLCTDKPKRMIIS